MTKSPSQKIASFFGRYPEKSYPEGQILIHANENPRSVYLLVSGTVRQYDISSAGNEIVVNVFKPGAFFPMSHAFTGLPNRYFFEAETAITIRQAPVEDALRFVQKEHDVALDLLVRVFVGADGLLRRLAHLMGGTASSRMLYELILESHRFGRPNGNGSVLLEVKEVELAARSGLARETVSREIRKLKAAKLVKTVDNSLIIKDLEALEAKLGTML